MPFVQAKCTNCGANLEIDNSRDAYICPYCNTPFVVEKAINNYNTYHQNYITNNVNADTVILQNTKDFEIKAGILISYNGESPDVILPEGPYAIGDRCFENMGIRSVVISEGITEIGHYAFANCKNLRIVKLSKSLIRIGDSAFYGCRSLETIKFPETLKSIEAFAFCNTALDDICIPSLTQVSPNSFIETPIARKLELKQQQELEKITKEKRRRERQQKEWFEDGLCPFCGG